MKSYLYKLVLFFAVLTGVSALKASAQQQPEQPDLYQMAEEEADKLAVCKTIIKICLLKKQCL